MICLTTKALKTFFTFTFYFYFYFQRHFFNI